MISRSLWHRSPHTGPDAVVPPTGSRAVVRYADRCSFLHAPTDSTGREASAGLTVLHECTSSLTSTLESEGSLASLAVTGRITAGQRSIHLAQARSGGLRCAIFDVYKSVPAAMRLTYLVLDLTLVVMHAHH